MKLEDLLRVLDRAADHFLIPCQPVLARGNGMCHECQVTLELKSELLKTASILRAEAAPRFLHGLYSFNAVRSFSMPLV